MSVWCRACDPCDRGGRGRGRCHDVGERSEARRILRPHRDVVLRPVGEPAQGERGGAARCQSCRAPCDGGGRRRVADLVAGDRLGRSCRGDRPGEVDRPCARDSCREDRSPRGGGCVVRRGDCRDGQGEVLGGGRHDAVCRREAECVGAGGARCRDARERVGSCVPGDPLGQGAGLGDGRDREAAGGDGEAARDAHLEGGGISRGERRRLLDGHVGRERHVPGRCRVADLIGEAVGAGEAARRGVGDPRGRDGRRAVVRRARLDGLHRLTGRSGDPGCQRGRRDRDGGVEERRHGHAGPPAHRVRVGDLDLPCSGVACGGDCAEDVVGDAGAGAEGGAAAAAGPAVVLQGCESGAAARTFSRAARVSRCRARRAGRAAARPPCAGGARRPCAAAARTRCDRRRARLPGVATRASGNSGTRAICLGRAACTATTPGYEEPGAAGLDVARPAAPTAGGSSPSRGARSTTVDAALAAAAEVAVPSHAADVDREGAPSATASVAVTSAPLPPGVGAPDVVTAVWSALPPAAPQTVSEREDTPVGTVNACPTPGP